MKRPPLWLAASALSAAITVGFGVARWIDHFRTDPYAEDTRIRLVAAHIGTTYGWSHIYDIDLQRASGIDLAHLYLSPPPSAWVTVPLLLLSVPIAYLVWTLVNLVAFAAACWVVCGGSRFVRLTILLVSLGLYPVHYQFWQGQWVATDLVFAALAWWLLDRDRPFLAGAALAVPFFFKTQDVLLLPLALLVSGRWRPIVGFVAVAVPLGIASLASLGVAGTQAWLHSLSAVQTLPSMTYAVLFGRGTIATLVEVGLGACALALAWYRRDRLDLVFSLGLVGTTASANYLHEFDVAILVLAAWIILRGEPSVVQKVWLLAGIAAMQFVAIGLPIPMLLWEAFWIPLLGLEPLFARRTQIAVRAQPQPART